MADLQKYFRKFHKTIKLDRFKENQTLRDKRDAVIGKLKERLPAVFEKHGEDVPEFDVRDQGSYEMGTGVIPLNGDFDIDQGVYVKVPTSDYDDPVELKERIYEALNGHTKEVKIRRPCVTVWYQRDGEHIYHVDLAIYSDGEANADGKSRIAMGKEHSGDEYRYWELSDPPGLTEEIFSRFEGKDRGQFRRVVRYLKRWVDYKFPPDGNAAPIGVGITVAAYYWLKVEKEREDIFSDDYRYDDLKALRRFTRRMLNHFRHVYHDGQFADRLVVELPVDPQNDLFEKMSNNYMGTFKERLEALHEALSDAEQEADPHEACSTLEKQFGDDFPVPEKSETAEKTNQAAIVSSGTSA